MEHEHEQRDILKWLLGQIYRADQRKKRLDQRLLLIKDKMDSPIGAVGYSPFPSSHSSGDGAASIVFKMAEIEERIYEQKEEIGKGIVRVMDILEYLPADSLEREICEMRHIDMMPWRDIQDALPMSKSQCHNRYNEALDILLDQKRVARMVKDNEQAYYEWQVNQETRRLKTAPKIVSGGYAPENNSGKNSRKKKTSPKART